MQTNVKFSSVLRFLIYLICFSGFAFLVREQIFQYIEKKTSVAVTYKTKKTHKVKN